MKARNPPPVLPDAVVVGPMKAGTTWLHGYLSARRDVCLPLGVKETFFFDRNWGKPLAWYARHFRHHDPCIHRRVMEVGASYFHAPEAPRRIVERLGEVDIIVLARDPVERAWSHYRHLLRMGYTRLPLEEAVVEFPEILAASRYRAGLGRWAEIFPAPRIKVLRFDRIRSQPETFLQDVCSALELELLPVEHEELDRNEAVVPRSLLAARGARSLANALRARQLYFLVNAAKRLRVKQLVFGKPAAAKQEISVFDELLLRRQLEQEMEAFQSLGR